MTTDQPIANEQALRIAIWNALMTKGGKDQSAALTVIEDVVAQLRSAPSPIANEEGVLDGTQRYSTVLANEEELLKRASEMVRDLVAALRTHTSTVDERGAVVALIYRERNHRGAYNSDQRIALTAVARAIERGEHLGHIAPLTTEVEVGPVSGSREPSPEGLGRSGVDPGQERKAIMDAPCEGCGCQFGSLHNHDCPVMADNLAQLVTGQSRDSRLKPLAGAVPCGANFQPEDGNTECSLCGRLLHAECQEGGQ